MFENKRTKNATLPYTSSDFCRIWNCTFPFDQRSQIFGPNLRVLTMLKLTPLCSTAFIACMWLTLSNAIDISIVHIHRGDLFFSESTSTLARRRWASGHPRPSWNLDWLSPKCPVSNSESSEKCLKIHGTVMGLWIYTICIRSDLFFFGDRWQDHFQERVGNKTPGDPRREDKLKMGIGAFRQVLEVFNWKTVVIYPILCFGKHFSDS